MPSPDNEDGTCGYLMNIYALPEYRGHGVGRKIVEYLLAEAKERGTQKIYLESSDMAMSLYQEIGFTPLEGYMKLTRCVPGRCQRPSAGALQDYPVTSAAGPAT